MNERYGYFQGGVGTALEQESPAANKLEQLYAQARQEREANEAKALQALRKGYLFAMTTTLIEKGWGSLDTVVENAAKIVAEIEKKLA